MQSSVEDEAEYVGADRPTGLNVANCRFEKLLESTIAQFHSGHLVRSNIVTSFRAICATLKFYVTLDVCACVCDRVL